MYRKIIKRALDLLVSITGLVVLSPILILVLIILFFHNNGKPFFFQVRPGKDQNAFTIIKFKTMTDKKDSQGHLLPDVERISFFGKWIRKMSIDELPQLLNVLKGDMSLIGPRPLLFNYIPLYVGDQVRRHEVKPGITGWAQVNGRNSISWTMKFELDIYYINHLSLFLDLKIFWLTILKVLKTEGVNQSEERPMQPFDGTN